MALREVFVLVFLTFLMVFQVGGVENSSGELYPVPKFEANNHSDVNSSFQISSLPSTGGQGVANSSFYGEGISYSENATRGVNFSGYLQLPTPCHEPHRLVTKHREDFFYFNMIADKPDDYNYSSCTQQDTWVRYNATFETDKPFKLVISYPNGSENVLNHPDHDLLDSRNSSKECMRDSDCSGNKECWRENQTNVCKEPGYPARKCDWDETVYVKKSLPPEAGCSQIKNPFLLTLRALVVLFY